MKIKAKSKLLIVILTIATILGFSGFIVGTVSANTEPLIFEVSPSGGDDTANIQVAFDAAIAAGPGNIVQLTEGNFYTNDIVVTDFEGIFRGVGREETIIDTLRGLDPETPPVPAYTGVDARGNSLEQDPRLIIFEGGGDISISDMTFGITHPHPGEWNDYAHGMWTTFITILGVTKRSSSLWSDKEVSVERVNFIGQEIDEWWVSNVNDGFVASGLSHPDSTHPTDRRWSLNPYYGHVKVTDCYFNNCRETGIGGLVDGEAIVENNVILNAGIGVMMALSENSKFIVSRNYIETDFVGIWAMQNRGKPTWLGEDPALPETPSQYYITYNHIQNIGFSDGIRLTDHWAYEQGQKGLEAVVSHNVISSPGLSWSPTFGYFAQDVIFEKNYITGNYVYGINPWLNSNRWIIEKNTFADISSSYGVISIEESNDCIVTKNKFYDVSGGGFGVVWCYGNRNQIIKNHYTHSGIPGWDLGEGCILIFFESHDNLVDEHLFPQGTDKYTQILDLGYNNKIV